MDSLKAFDGQWAILALIVFNFTVIYLNTHQWLYYESINFEDNLIGNIYWYKLATEKAGEGTAVLLDQDGDIGSYNRANRSLHHMIENCLPTILALPILFYIYPIVTITYFVIYCIARLLH